MSSKAQTGNGLLEGFQSKGVVVPVAVSMALKCLGNSDVSAQNLLDTLSGPQMNSLQTAFRSKLGQNPEAKMEFSKISDKKAKMEWLAQYVLDPQHGVCKGYNKVTVSVGDKSLTNWSWLTEEQAADLMKSASHASILCKSGDVESRPHEFPSLAAEGVKQYHIHQSMVQAFSKTQGEAGALHETELKPDEYLQVATAMRADSTETPAKRKKVTPKVKPEESPEEKRLKEAKTEKQGALRKAKHMSDKVLNSLHDDKASLQKLGEKGYPESMTTFFLSKIEEVESLQQELHSHFVQSMASQARDESIEQFTMATQTSESLSMRLETAFSKYKKQHAIDIKRMTA